MNDAIAISGAERRKRIERLVSRWDELNRERAGEPVPVGSKPDGDEDERRDVLWLTSPTPYPGLRSFGPDESALFFAREAQTNGLVQRLAKSNIMVVLGGSGCGKSSLVRAGLIPRLSTSASVPGLKGRWYVVEFRPGLDPNEALVAGFRDSIVAPVARFAPPDDPFLGRRALVKALGLDAALVTRESEEALRDEAVTAIRSRLFGDADGESLRAAPLRVEGVFDLAREVLDRLDIELSRGVRAGPPNLLMLIDQFEEAFRSEVTPEGQNNLCLLIKTTFKQHPPSLFLALTLRSEELHRCAEAGLANIVTETAYLLGPLDDELARREIIVRPAQAVFGDWIWAHESPPESDTAPFDREVVQLLMDESQHAMAALAHKSDYLPLLQHALQHLWDAAMLRWQKELATGVPVGLTIGIADLEAIADGVTPDFLVRCLNKYADRARDEAIEKAARHFTGPDAQAKAERVVRTAFCAMARKDDRGNWARRFVTPARVAELLDDDPQDKAAVKEVLRTFKRHGYLNRSGTGKDKKFDVSHEALIRNWDTYNEWLRELGALEHSLREVANNLADDAAEAPVGRVQAMLGWAWDWIREKNESRAREVIPDRFRDDVGKVVGPAKSISTGLAAALLADGERRKAPRQPGVSDGQALLAEAREREALEQQMRGRIGSMAEPWQKSVAASKRYLPRWIIVPGFITLLAAITTLGWWLSSSTNDRLSRSRDRLYFGAVAAAGNLDVQRWLEAGALELQHVYNRIDEHRGQENWGDGSAAGMEMYLSLTNWERAARQLTGAIIIRDSAAMPVAPQANCLTSGSELMRQAGNVAYGIAFDPLKKVWLPQIRAGSNANAAVQDSKTFALAKEGDMVCLSQYAPMLMVWPAGTEDEPLFWMLRPRCREISGGACATWLMEPLRLRVLFVRKYLEGLKDRPWRALWLKRDRDERADLWNNKQIYDFETRVPGAPPRVGFAFKFANSWLVADTVPGMVAPYVLSEPADKGGMSSCTESPCVHETPSSAMRVSYKKPPAAQILEGQPLSDQAQAGAEPESDECKDPKNGNCLIILSIEAVPSEGNAFVGVWNWMVPSLPIDNVTTNGQIMDYRAADGLWRRGVIGVKALAQHVEFLAGTTGDDPSKVKVRFRDLSEACRLIKCLEWKPLTETRSSSWNW